MNLYQDIFFRGADTLRGRKTLSRLSFLRKSQYWPRERMLAWQLDRLNELVAQAQANSPFYGERLAGIRPFESLSEIEQIPVLTKSHIGERLEDIKCRNVPKSRFVATGTGGSTGEPTFFFWDKRGRDWNRGSVYRSAEWAGVALGERAVQMSGTHLDLTERQKRMTKLIHSFQRYKDLPMGAVTEQLLEGHLGEIVDYRPTSIWGYASALDLLAQHVEAKHPGIDLSFVRALLTSSETLRPSQRERINRVFGGDKVFDQYGSTEFYLAAECRAHDGYHLNSEVLFVEIVDHDNQAVPPGEVGRILVTDLTNHASPFIRYEIGDIGVMADYEECVCGVTLPRLACVEGRISEAVVLRDRVLTTPSLVECFDFRPGIKAFQVRQESLDELKIVVVPDEGYDRDFIDSMMGSLARLVGDSKGLELVEQDHIEVPASGKRQYVVSDVSSDHF